MIKQKNLIEAYLKGSTPTEIFRDMLEKLLEYKQSLTSLKERLESAIADEDDLVARVEARIVPAKNGHTPTRAELTQIITPLIPKAIPGKPGRPGKDGILIPAEEIRDKIKSLKGENKLSIFDLKDFEWLRSKAGKDRLQFTSAANTIITDTTLTGKGTVDSPLHVVSATGGTPVREEDVSTNGSGTAFTLASIPLSNSLQLFRGGARITVVGGDYTLVGKNITLASALQSGETLTADYLH